MEEELKRRKFLDLDVVMWKKEEENGRRTGEIETEEGIDPDHETEGDDHEVETDIGDAEVTAETETGTGDTGEAEVGTGGRFKFIS